MRILIHENNQFGTDLTRSQIIAEIPKCEVDIAYSIEEVSNLIMDKNKYDVLVIDIDFSNEYGVKLLKNIQSRNLQTVVIVLTEYSDETLLFKALKNGADDFVVKKEGYLSKLIQTILFQFTILESKLEKINQAIRVLYLQKDLENTGTTISNFNKKYAAELSIETTSDSSELIEKIIKQTDDSSKFHVVVMDFKRPGLDALELLKYIRQALKLDLPIVIVGGQGSEEEAMQFVKLGADAFLIKQEDYMFSLHSLINREYQKCLFKRQKKSIEESEWRYRLLSENAGDVIFTLNKDFKNTYVSPSVFKMFGYLPEEINNMHIIETLTPDSYEKVLQLYSEYLSNPNNFMSSLFNIGTLEVQIMNKEKNAIWCEVKYSGLMDENKNLNGVLGVIRDISDRKFAELELKKSHEEYKMFFDDDLTGDNIATVDGQLLNCNVAFLKIFGFSSKEEALQYNMAKIYHRKNEIENIIKQIKKYGKLINYEYELVRVDGRIIYAIANIIGIFDSQNMLVAIKSYIFDNTERKIAGDELVKLSQAIEQSPVAVILTDTEGNIEYTNPKFCEISGYSLLEVKGKNPRFLKSGNTSKKGYKELWDTIISGNEWNGEFLNKRKDGKLYWELATISAIKNTEGKITHYLAVKEDITNRKMLIEELIAAKEKAEESNRLKTAFLANISHEIRTPINGVCGFAELLREEIQNETHKEYIDIITKSANRLLNTVNDIVDVAKIETGQQEVYIELFDLNNLLKEVYTIHNKHSKIDVRILLEKNKTLMINSDKIKIYQIVNNLIVNSLKFTPKGTIQLGYFLNNGEVTIFVKDTGIGIEEKYHKKIFDRFVQVESGYSRKFEGTGLGLSIVKHFVDLLGGKIWLESELGKGSCFYVSLPDILEENSKTERIEQNSVL